MKINSIRDRLLASTMVGGAALLALTAVPAVTLLAPTTAMAQSQTGSLRVTVAGSDGAALAGATVTVSSPNSLVTRTGTTDAEGRVRLVGLDPATNYTLQIEASGYDAFTASNVAVVTGREQSVGYSLGASSVDDIIVTGTSLAAVDVTSATVSTTLTLDIVESLPTGRNYQSYLQLVPGVKPSTTGNPSSRSGNNYRDAGGAIGSSTDNVYFLDGVDVTDPYTGSFGANFNSEIIQEQQVIVGGVPAEYNGGSGLISRVVTKSGGNDWSGSVNYYFQNDGLVAEDEHNTSGGFSAYDTAVTLGGPILKDRLWFYASYQKLFREDEVLNTTTGDIMRTVENSSENVFGKLTWQVTDADRLTATYFSDPTEITGSSLATTLNNRDARREQGGDNYKLEYSRTWGDFVFNAYYFTHEGQVSTFAADTSTRNNVGYYRTPSTLALRQRGGLGSNLESYRNRDEWGVNLEYYLDTSFGSHTFKAGYLSTENVYEEDSTQPGGPQYTSIATENSGATFDLIANGADLNGDGENETFFTASSLANGDQTFIIDAIEASADRAYYISLLDGLGGGALDGVITDEEVEAYQFTNTTGNPHNQVNVYRSVRVIDQPYEIKSEGRTFFLQDTWTLDQLTVNAGVRAEEWTHYGSDGSKLFTFDWEIAPRVSVVYDLFGDGRSKVFGFAGRYYDPIRNDMTDFAGALTGPVNHEQIHLGDRWLTFRTRGGATVPDSVFAPNLRTPFTDEYMIGASTTLRSDILVSASATTRRTRDIFEDYALYIYSGTRGLRPGWAPPGSPLFLPLSYFGFDTAPNANYTLGTLAGGKRNYTGLEFTVQKFKTDNWQGSISYTHNIAEGNTNSDGNADIQGDVIYLDPRAPGMWGEQPGNIKHQIQAYGSYEFDFGLQVSGVFNWNSGALFTPGVDVYGRYMPPSGAEYQWGGVTAPWLRPGGIGSETTPSYYTFDMRFAYDYDLPIGGVELFLDVFNILNNQAATNVERRLAGSGQYDFKEANTWVQPRRAYLGVRYAF